MANRANFDACFGVSMTSAESHRKHLESSATWRATQAVSIKQHLQPIMAPTEWTPTVPASFALA
jgi:hypothetical protein